MTTSSGPADLPTLLSEREWVRRVASALASDPASAEDAEQDAWLAAMRSPPRAGSVRGWFRSVLRSRVADGARRGERRRRREESAARPEGQPSAADIVARAEAHRQVVETVLALDEPWRTTVVLRYFEDLTPAEIGARLAIPADTVRARLRRAHDDLRRRLAPADGRRRAAWMLVLGAPMSRGTSRAAADTSLTGGTIVASSTTKVLSSACAAALLVAGLVAWMWPSAGDGDRRTDATGSGAAPAPELASAGRTEKAPPRAKRPAETGTETAADARGSSIVGEVRFVSGDRPAAGAVVELAGAGGPVRATADALGAFRFGGIEPAGVLAVTAAAPGVAPARVVGIRLGEREVRRLDTLWLDEPVRADVRVVGPDGSPVAGASVEAYRARERIERQDWDAVAPVPEATQPTDPAGHARFEALSVGNWTFRAVHPDFAPAGAGPRPVLRGGVSFDLVVRLDRGNELTGVVTGADGRPLAGAMVVALPPVEADLLMVPKPLDPLRVETTTDAAGRYAFKALATGEHSLAVVLPGTLPARVGVLSIPSVSRFDIRLDGGTLAGRVTEEGTGRPIEGARVRAAVWRSHSPTYMTAVSDADGRWSVVAPVGGILQGPARGDGDAVSRPVNFDVEKDGYVFAPEASPTPWRNVWVFGEKVASYDVVMRPAASLSGTVTGPDGAVAGAAVVADVWSPLRGSLTQTTVTDASGHYRFGGLAAGRARVAVSRDGFFQKASPGGPWRTGPAPDPAAVAEIPGRGEVKLDVRLERGLDLLGVVVDSAGKPVAAASVECSADDSAPLTVTSDAAGNFAFTGLRPAREVTLRAKCDGWADAEPLRASPREPLEESKRVRLVMERAGVVAGRVVGPDGGAVPGAWVQVAPAKLALDTGYEVVGVWQHAPRWPVAADGSFEAPIAWMDGAAKEGVVARAGAPGLAPAITERLAAPNGGAAQAGTLKLEAGNRLTGRVVAADGSGPVARAEISFQNERLPPAFAQRRDWSTVGRDSTPFETVARADADGRFVVEGLPAWRYEVRVIVDGFPLAAQTVAVPQEDELTIEVPGMRPIAGRVEFDDGAPGAQVVVIAHWTNGQPGIAGFAETESDGSFELPFLQEGRYTLEARRPSDRVLDVLPTTTGEIESGTRDVKIVVVRGGGRIAGRCATSDGAAVPGAVLYLKPVQGGAAVNARSFPDGRFEASGLTEGTWTITAFADRSVGPPSSFGRRLVTDGVDVPVGARDVSLEFRVAAPIAGRVVREDGAVPAGALMLQARRSDGGKWTVFAPVGADGAFTFDSTSGGMWTLSLVDRNTGGRLAIAGTAEFAGGTSDVRVVVASASALSGRVVDERGRAIAGVRVVAKNAAGAAVETVSDVEGRFTWTEPGAGPFEVEATLHEAGRATATNVQPGAADLVLTLRAAEAVAARIVGADGAPVRGADVDLAAEGGGVVAHLRTDADGRFVTKALAPGEYVVTVTGRDGHALDAPLPAGRVRSGATGAVLRI